MIVKRIDNIDLDKIKIFLSKINGEKYEKYEGLFNYWWFDNPAYLDKYDKGYILLNDRYDSVVSFIGRYPSFFRYSHNKITVFNLTNWYVEEKYRQHNLALFLKTMKFDEKILLFNTSPTRHVKKILKILKFSRLPVANEKNYYLVIDFYSIVSKLKYLSLISYIFKPIFFIIQYIYSYFFLKIKRTGFKILYLY